MKESTLNDIRATAERAAAWHLSKGPSMPIRFYPRKGIQHSQTVFELSFLAVLIGHEADRADCWRFEYGDTLNQTRDGLEKRAGQLGYTIERWNPECD